MARRLAALLLAPSLMLSLAAGCSSTGVPTADGAAGATGAGGTPGTGGAPAGDAGDLCAQLPAAYAAAFQRAVSCDPSLSTPQCTQMAANALPCTTCVLFVHDATELDQLRAEYNAAHCPQPPCPALACKVPASGTCVPNDGGTTGTCSFSTPQ